MRKPISSEKSGLFAIGKIANLSNYVEALQRIANEPVNEMDLDLRVQKAYQESRDLCYYYDENGNPRAGEFDLNRTCTYAIETGYYTDNKQKIYATYTRDRYGNWNGIYFTTSSRLFNQLNSYRFGFLSFKDYSDANTFICSLHEELLPGETWEFKSSSYDDYRPKTTYDILQSYLQYVFEKLVTEYNDPSSKNYQKIVFSSNSEGVRYALFNTGLLSRFAKDIFLLGEVYQHKENGLFTFSNPVIAPGKVDLIRDYGFCHEDLSPMPNMVEFFRKVDEIIYDAKVEIDLSFKKLKHAIDDGVKRHRYPEKYEKLFSDGNSALIATKLTTAIENAQKIAMRNYKYVVPQYRPASNNEPGKIQFLMPIYLDTQYNAQPDFALVLNDEHIGNSRFYIPETILELSWAYNNARVICKPDDTWLTPSRIEETNFAEPNIDLDDL